ncbi:MAG: tRNA pseudouridine(55) synthase TruB [Oscillospiraceae bacterium]|nr:tRNA pseudouridine(55) synthase TruB [Oscillospiraceae bacterium]
MNGFVCLDKPQGITSFVAAAKVRRIFGEKKTGHTGTLDPLATGVLPVAFGSATRFIELIPDHDKAYRATFLLGKSTDTLDITGNVLCESKVTVKKEDVEAVLPGFLGESMQLPPMYSALKKDGVRLYELARQGKEVERERRKINIFSLSLVGQNANEYTIDVSCSAGTYIRSLIADIGEKLGCPAVMTALTRTKANGIPLGKCVTIEELERLKNEDRLFEAVIPVDELLSYPSVFVTKPQAIRFSNGGELDLDRIKCNKTDGFRLVYSPDKVFLGVGEIRTESGVMAVKKVIPGYTG